MTSIKLPLEA